MKTAHASNSVNICCGKQTISIKSTKIRYNIQLNLKPHLGTNSKCISPSQLSDKILVVTDLITIITGTNMKNQLQQKEILEKNLTKISNEKESVTVAKRKKY